MKIGFLLPFALGVIGATAVLGGAADERFERLAASFVQEVPGLSPVGATQLGDHRFDHELDSINETARRAAAELYRGRLERLARSCPRNRS